MKKIFCVLLAFIIIFCNIYGAYASFASPIVQRLVSSAAMAGTGGSITLPALIRGTTSGGGSVSSWITLAIPGGNVAKIAGAIIGIGAGLALDYAFLKGAEYLASKNITKGTNGTITQTTSLNIPNGSTVATYNTGTGAGFYNSEDAAYAAADADAAAHSCGYAHGGCANGVQWWAVCAGARKYYYNCGSPTHSESVASTMTAAQIEAMLTLDLAANNTGAMGFGNAVVAQAADALENPQSPVANNSAAMAAIKTALSNSITAGQKTNLETQATTAGDVAVPTTTADTNQLTAAQIAGAMQGALQGQGLSATAIAAAIRAANPAATAAEIATSLASQGLTAAQIATAIRAANPAATAADIATAIRAANPSATAEDIGIAVAANIPAASTITKAETTEAVKEGTKEAMNDETGVTMPLDPSFIVPTKLSLTTVLTSFMNSIKNMPFLAALQGVTISCSGSSMLCLYLPEKFGGTVCWDAGNISSELNVIGSVFLSFTTIIMFIYIFRSN